MLNLDKAKQALQDALSSPDEWYAVEFARDYGAKLITEVEKLQNDLAKIDIKEHNLIKSLNRY